MFWEAPKGLCDCDSSVNSSPTTQIHTHNLQRRLQILMGFPSKRLWVLGAPLHEAQLDTCTYPVVYSSNDTCRAHELQVVSWQNQGAGRKTSWKCCCLHLWQHWEAPGAKLLLKPPSSRVCPTSAAPCHFPSSSVHQNRVFLTCFSPLGEYSGTIRSDHQSGMRTKHRPLSNQ